MITSLLRSIGRNFALLSLCGAAVGVVGCVAGSSELMTYAEQSRGKGLKQFAAGDYENAAGSFRNAVRQDPRDYKSFYYLGACYDHARAYKQAAQAYQSSIQVMDVTMEGKADKAFRAKTIDGLAIATAKSEDRTAQIAMPQPGKRPAEDAWLRAKINRYVGDHDAAIENYTQASLQDPNDFYIAKDYALYLEQLGQMQQADAQLRRAYRMNSKDKEIVAALRRVGTVPGPALKEKNELARPPVPQGPIPEVELKMPTFGNNNPQPAAAEPAPVPAGPTVQAPRD